MMIVAAMALFDAGGRVLVQQRRPQAHMGGMWEFPGGKVEADETCEAALRRELREELGITIEAVEPYCFAEEGNLLLLLYRGTAWRGEPAALQADALAWHGPAELAYLPMPPADRPLVAALIKGAA